VPKPKSVLKVIIQAIDDWLESRARRRIAAAVEQTMKRNLHEIAEILEWLATTLREAANGSDEACATARCFMRDWCGMIAVGPAVMPEDVEDLFRRAEGYVAEMEYQKELEREEARRCCGP
jgi:hypothetical protein